MQIIFGQADELIKKAAEKSGISERNIRTMAKQKGLSDSDIEAEAAKRGYQIERNDEQTIETIKRSMIKTLINTTPKYLSSSIEYKNWDEAMKTLKESE